MKTAFAYARVSTLEQKEKKNSIPEQFTRIEHFSTNNDILIKRQFSDSDSAFHDENRTDFNEMIRLALIEKPDFIVLDDSSRFARTREIAIDTKKKLRSNGINILYSSEPNVDTNTVSGFWLEGIQEIKNEATSREISFHTKKGMTGNIQNRDEETGWCYKNGGKAPYGWKRKQLYKGIDQKGKPIYKTIWELDDETYPIVRKIIVDLYTDLELSYKSIRDYLNKNNIKNSNGDLWSTSTIASMLREERLEQYAGTGFWNKENNSLIGTKFNDKSLWVIVENAHPSIITKEELKRALERKNKTSNSMKHVFKSTSDYLLSGLNLEGNFLFTCSECGGHVIGSSTGKKHARNYCCGNNRHKGKLACSNNMKVDKDWIEDKIITCLEGKFSEKNIQKSIEKVYKEICNIDTTYTKQIKNLNTQINTTDKEIQNLLNSIKSGINPNLIANEINNLNEKRDYLNNELTQVKYNIANKPTISKKDIEKYFYNIRKVFCESNSLEKKELIKAYIHNISLNEKEHQLEISLYFQGCPVMEQVAGIEPA